MTKRKRSPIPTPDRSTAIPDTLRREVYVWLRQDYDTDTSYTYFQRYLDMGALDPRQRSLAKLAAELQMSPEHLRAMSAERDWVSRARAFDDFIRDDLRRKDLISDWELMLLEQMEMMSELQHKLRAAIDNLPGALDWQNLPGAVNALMKWSHYLVSLKANPEQLKLLAEKAAAAQAGGNQTNISNTSQVVIVMPDNGRGDSNHPRMNVQTIEAADVRQLPSGQEDEEE